MNMNQTITFKRRLVYTAVASCFTVMPAYANPSGATVINGNVSFATQGNTLTITNTPNAIINWQRFGIGQNEITRFVQQSPQSAVLNRVVGQDPSLILGKLLSNGRVFLINPNGIVFGKGSKVDVAGLVASTLKLSNGDFLAGKLNFTDGAGAGSIVNEGNIRTGRGGNIYLIAPDITNSGIITSPQGEILLAAGHSVNLMDAGNPDVQVVVSAPATQAVNLGTLMAQSGKIGLYGALVSQQGVVNADTAVRGQNGNIIFKASQNVALAQGSVTSARGGGQIKALADMQNGQVDVAGMLDASAPVSGNGGFIETSAAHVKVADSAQVTTLAAHGKNGTWLIDPNDFTISFSGDISGATLSAALSGGNVTILSDNGSTGVNGDIFVFDNVSWAANTKLTLTAVRNIDINADITATGATSGLELNASGDVTVKPASQDQSVIVKIGGNIKVNAATLNVLGGSASSSADGGGSRSADATMHAGGNINITTSNGVTVQGGDAFASASFGSGSTHLASANAELSAVGSITINGGSLTVRGGTARAIAGSAGSSGSQNTAITNANALVSGSSISLLNGGSVDVSGGYSSANEGIYANGNATAKSNANLLASGSMTLQANNLTVWGGAARAKSSCSSGSAAADANARIHGGSVSITTLGSVAVRGGDIFLDASYSGARASSGGKASVRVNGELSAAGSLRVQTISEGSIVVAGGSGGSAYAVSKGKASVSGNALMSGATVNVSTTGSLSVLGGDFGRFTGSSSLNGGGATGVATTSANAELSATGDMVLNVAGNVALTGGPVSGPGTAQASAGLASTGVINMTIGGRSGLTLTGGGGSTTFATYPVTGTGVFSQNGGVVTVTYTGGGKLNVVNNSALGQAFNFSVGTATLPPAVISAINFTVGEVNGSAPPFGGPIEGIRFGDHEDGNDKPECS